MRKHTKSNIKAHHTPASEPQVSTLSWSNYFTFALVMMSLFSLLLIPSCMQAQSQEVTIISKGEKHDS